MKSPQRRYNISDPLSHLWSKAGRKMRTRHWPTAKHIASSSSLGKLKTLRHIIGADRSRVIRLVLREAMLLLAVGLTAGVLLALWAARAAAALLFGLQPYDPVSMVAAIALLTVIALGASYGPARRAAALEPMVALRDE